MKLILRHGKQAGAQLSDDANEVNPGQIKPQSHGHSKAPTLRIHVINDDIDKDDEPRRSTDSDTIVVDTQRRGVEIESRKGTAKSSPIKSTRKSGTGQRTKAAKPRIFTNTETAINVSDSINMDEVPLAVESRLELLGRDVADAVYRDRQKYTTGVLKGLPDWSEYWTERLNEGTGESQRSTTWMEELDIFVARVPDLSQLMKKQ